MTKLKNPTTKRHFAIFKKECQYWLNYFGIKDYKIFIEHNSLEGSLGELGYDLANRQCTISLATDWVNNEITDRELKCNAFHEVCELLLVQLRYYGEGANSKSIVDEHVHMVIRTLENTIFREKRGG